MSAFEHVIVLLSFVYALAIAHLLLTVAGIVRGWNRVRFSWFHAYWMLNALIVLVVDWISFYDLRQIKGWSMPVIFMTIFIALIEYLQAALVCPEIPPEGPIDLAVFHNSQSRRYIAAFGLSAADALIANIVLGGAFSISAWMMQNLAVLPLLLIATVAAIWRNRVVDIAAVVLLLCVWSFYFFDLQATLH
jgi:hypothetical protein